MKANDKLSRLVSTILAELGSCSQAFEEMHLYHAPSECGHDISNASSREIKKILTDAGYTPDEFIKEVEDRTTPKFAYDLGLYQVLE
jgi:hypothetical protein